nr:MAG TPA: hypothetical protein [Caudoviricetes sp.]
MYQHLLQQLQQELEKLLVLLECLLLKRIL